MPPRRQKPPEQKQCNFPRCQGPTVGRSKYCLVHELIEGFRARTKAHDLGYLAGVVCDALGEKLVLPPMPGPEQAFHQWQSQHTPRPEKQAPRSGGCFQVLGLDQRKATKADVRRVQKELAKIYHSDKNEKGVSSDKMKEINAAVQECLKML